MFEWPFKVKTDGLLAFDPLFLVNSGGSQVSVLNWFEPTSFTEHVEDPSSRLADSFCLWLQ
jgi:hypothetical protein